MSRSTVATARDQVAGEGLRQRDLAARLQDAEVSLREPLLDADAAAALLNVSVSWLREATRQGQLPCLMIGRYVRYTRPMLESWLERNAMTIGHRERLS